MIANYEIYKDEIGSQKGEIQNKGIVDTGTFSVD
jgi:hypothetical protein